MDHPFRLGLMAAGLLFLFGCREAVDTDVPTDSRRPRTFQVPPDFVAPNIPADNPLTEEGIALGRRLFFDRTLSRDRTLACADCHIPSRAFSDTVPLSRGVDGRLGTLNAPGLLNVAWNSSLFWDGRAGNLESQALEPVPNPLEMHLPWDEAVARLSADPRYRRMFRAAFAEEGVSREKVAAALAQFQRTLVSFDSKYDRFLRGEVELTPRESSGLKSFGGNPGRCTLCHSGLLFTNDDFRNDALDTAIDGTGRGKVTGDPFYDGKFRTPSLRNVTVTGPYMHDGRFRTLEEVLRHYSSGGQPSRTADILITGRPAPLGEEEMRDLIAFLGTLTDSSALANPDFAKPADLP